MAVGPLGLTPAEFDGMLLQNLLESDEQMTYFKDLQSRFVRVSRGHVLRYNLQCETDMIGTTDFDHFDHDFARTAMAGEQEIIRTGEPLVEIPQQGTWPDGSPLDVLTTKRPLRLQDGTIVGTFGINRDVTEQRRIERQLAAVLEMSPDAITRLGLDLRHAYANPAAIAMMGGTEQRLLGLTYADLASSEAEAALMTEALTLVVSTGEPTQVEYHLEEAGKVRYVESRIVAERDSTGISGLLVMTRDVTARKRAELALADQVMHDPLTGLANRVLLRDRLQGSLTRLQRTPGSIALLFVDLDRFKRINDTFGHAFGDAMLVEFAVRMRGIARQSDTIARLGGDEFVILCDRIAAPEDAGIVASRIEKALIPTFTYGGHECRISASIGISVSSDPRADPAEMIKHADQAMYRAKLEPSQTNRFCFYSP